MACVYGLVRLEATVEYVEVHGLAWHEIDNLGHEAVLAHDDVDVAWRGARAGVIGGAAAAAPPQRTRGTTEAKDRRRRDPAGGCRAVHGTIMRDAYAVAPHDGITLDTARVRP